MHWTHRKTVRWLGTVLALPLAMLILIVGGSIIPANRYAIQPTRGVTVYVYTNGVHSGLVLPTFNAFHDWRRRVPANDLPDPRHAGNWLIFGWGQRDFYLNTPTWAEVNPLIVLRAAIGSDATLMHVDHLQGLWRGPDLRPLILTPTQYSALVKSIDADFAPGAAIRGYGADDIFYPAHGRYSVLRTCNDWTGSKLRTIGVKVGLWTPLSWSVLRWF